MRAERVAALAFDLGGRVLDIRAHGHGLINDTFVVTLDSGRRALLQRLNRHVFPRPEAILRNLRTLVAHAAAGHRSSAHALRVPAMYPARNGADFVCDAQGDYWRASEFIENARSVDTLADALQASEVGAALGGFHARLHDLPPERLEETLPGFHVTPLYLEHYDRAVAEITPAEAALAQALAFVETRRALADALERPRQEGRLPVRVVHNDPKLNNFLFDITTGRVVALIDLDTVQPGLVHHDIGDCLRSCANRAGEGPEDLARVRFDLDVARAWLKGYLAEARAFLGPEEMALLYDAIRLLPFELGLRFLTDHLEGDRYFRTHFRGQNLHRAQVQFRLVEDIERQEVGIREALKSS